MENILSFYYNLKFDNLKNIDDNYYFFSNGNMYVFKLFHGNPDNIRDIYNLNLYMANYVNVDRIILNKDNNIVTAVNNSLYILILTIEKDKKIRLSTISNLSLIKIPNIKSLERNSWEILWGNLVDYYETQIGQNEKKYPLIRESFDYYVGMAENAISYVVNTKRETAPDENDSKVIAHNNLYCSLFDPLNIIFDHKSRDLAEYIKLSFFNNDEDIFEKLDEYFYYNKFSLYGIRILFARILYPSFYFKLYDEIIRGKKDEKELNYIINNVDRYEIFLYSVYLYLNKYYSIPEIEWLKKRGFDSRLDINFHL